jgi:hypothetical protein
VFLCSSARIGRVPVAALLRTRGERMDELRHKFERELDRQKIAMRLSLSARIELASYTARAYHT